MHQESEIESSSDDEDIWYEVIKLDPSVLYESDDDLELEAEIAITRDANNKVVGVDVGGGESSKQILDVDQKSPAMPAQQVKPRNPNVTTANFKNHKRKLDNVEISEVEEAMGRLHEDLTPGREKLEVTEDKADAVEIENLASNKKIKLLPLVDEFSIGGSRTEEVKTSEEIKTESTVASQTSNTGGVEDMDIDDSIPTMCLYQDSVDKQVKIEDQSSDCPGNFFKSELEADSAINSSGTITEMDTSVDVSYDNSLLDENSNDSVRKVRRKLNLEEYKMRRAKEKPEASKPLFDLPKKLAAYELSDIPATLPMLILPTDSSCFSMMSGDDNATFDQEENRMVINLQNYEEITLVSMGTNTDITIPPEEKKPANNCLKNIVNTLNKDNVELLMKSSTTLFSSIQAVVQGKCTSTDSNENSNDAEHGEDKIIMHLPKNRLKPFKCTAGIQTDSHSLFPPLVVSPTLIYNRVKHSRSYRRKISRSRSSSPAEDYDRVKVQKRYTRSQHSTHSSSMNSASSSSSESSSDSDSDSSSYSSQSSSDSLKHFSNRHSFRIYDRDQRDQGMGKYPEERRIVYVGQLEEEATKEDLRRKFLTYGTIKKISMHVKEDGLRYGFVTFAEASCAYEVLDKFSKDPLINKYDIRFGGRRRFCKQTYADLDSLAVEKEYTEPQKPQKQMSFEDLLKAAQKKLLAKK